MCFVWISEQTAIISLYNINWLVFITQTECVYCAVRTGPLCTIHVNISLQIIYLTSTTNLNFPAAVLSPTLCTLTLLSAERAGETSVPSKAALPFLPSNLVPFSFFLRFLLPLHHVTSVCCHTVATHPVSRSLYQIWWRVCGIANTQ
jgi:hypothetical protein